MPTHNSKFRPRNWTHDEVIAVYDASAEFRKLALRAAKSINPEAKATDAVVFAAEAARIGNKVGGYLGTAKTPRVPHPGLVLWWIAEYNTSKGRFTAMTGDYRAVVEALSALVGQFRVPRNCVSAWNRFASRISGIDVSNPYWFQRDVQKLPVPSTRAHRGVRLKTLVVRVPYGVTTRMVGDRKVAGPETFRHIRLDFTTAKARERFGEVWMGVSADGKTMWLASVKLGQLRLDQMIESYRSQTWNNQAKFARPFAGRGKHVEKGTVPPALQKALTAAKVTT